MVYPHGSLAEQISHYALALGYAQSIGYNVALPHLILTKEDGLLESEFEMVSHAEIFQTENIHESLKGVLVLQLTDLNIAAMDVQLFKAQDDPVPDMMPQYQMKWARILVERVENNDSLRKSILSKKGMGGILGISAVAARKSSIPDALDLVMGPNIRTRLHTENYITMKRLREKKFMCVQLPHNEQEVDHECLYEIEDICIINQARLQQMIQKSQLYTVLLIYEGPSDRINFSMKDVKIILSKEIEEYLKDKAPAMSPGLRKVTQRAIETRACTLAHQIYSTKRSAFGRIVYGLLSEDSKSRFRQLASPTMP
jgi:hypothetical protein